MAHDLSGSSLYNNYTPSVSFSEEGLHASIRQTLFHSMGSDYVGLLQGTVQHLTSPLGIIDTYVAPHISLLKGRKKVAMFFGLQKVYDSTWHYSAVPFFFLFRAKCKD